MKKVLLLITILLFVFKTGHGQTNMYHPFPDSNAVWLTGCSGLASGGCACYGGYCLFNSATQDSLGGDTIIGAYMYNKVWTESSNTLWNDGPTTCPPGVNNYSTTFSNYVYDGAIRQDSIHKKVYYRNNSSTSVEYLLYDFNLNVGDTLPPTYINNANYAYVSKIDSFIISGNYHKRFWLWLVDTTPPISSDSGYAAIIEGMGSTNGLFQIAPNLMFESSCALNCIKINESSIYPSATTTCTSIYNTTGIKIIENKVLFNISPNPSSGTISIAGNVNIDELKVSDMLGQIVYETKPNTTNTTLTLTDAGVYFITLTSGTETTTKKVIVSK